MEPRLSTQDLTLCACSAQVARAIGVDRAMASRLSGFALHSDWPDADLPGVLESYAKLIEAYPDKIGWGVWLFVLNGVVIGDGGFHGPPKEGRVEIGYSIVAEHRKRGLATEAVAALCDWGIKHGAKSIVAYCDPDNEASARVVDKCGFREMPMSPTGDGSRPHRKWVFWPGGPLSGFPR
ncbi:phosphinothricin acetyltransferase [Planctomycetaceae bacterium]|nr:phosphinothricin acetyltransferase [Planctomycetaceae bacterium]